MNEHFRVLTVKDQEELELILNDASCDDYHLVGLTQFTGGRFTAVLEHKAHFPD
jgi:hypothetical protein